MHATIRILIAKCLLFGSLWAQGGTNTYANAGESAKFPGDLRGVSILEVQFVGEAEPTPITQIVASTVEACRAKSLTIPNGFQPVVSISFEKDRPCVVQFRKDDSQDAYFAIFDTFGRITAADLFKIHRMIPSVNIGRPNDTKENIEARKEAFRVETNGVPQSIPQLADPK